MNSNPKNWHHLGRWLQPPISSCYWNDYNTIFPFEGPQGLSGKVLVIDGHFFFWKPDIRCAHAYFVRISTEQSKAHLDAIISWVKEAHEQARKAVQGLDALDEQTIVKRLNQTMKAIIPQWWFFFFFEDDMQQSLAHACQEADIDVQTIIASLRPLENSFAVQKTNEAVELLATMKAKGLEQASFEEVSKQDSQLAQRIKKHLERFAFCGVHHFIGEPYNYESFLGERKLLHAETAKAIPEQLSWIVRFCSIAMWTRTHMAETSGMIQLGFRKHLERICLQQGLDKQAYLDLTGNELLALVAGKGLPENYAQRKEKFALYSDPQEIVVTGEAVDQLLASLQLTAAGELKGRGATTGLGEGKVRIVIGPGDANKVEKGEVMVCPETSPDFMPAFSKVAAIITEVGGLTSHAAIVSREMGIPCVIGVKGATTTLRDGDYVIVDGKSGMITRTDAK